MLTEIKEIDNPVYKERIMSELYGQFIGFLKSRNLILGKEYDTKIQDIFQCSKKVIWIDQLSEDFQITVYLNSIQMFVEYGVVRKKDMEVIHRNKIEGLRYKISSCTDCELIDSHQELFDGLFEDFKIEFDKINIK